MASAQQHPAQGSTDAGNPSPDMRADQTTALAQLRSANSEAQESRRAALNLMEDAIQSRQTAESLNAALRESEERYRTLFDLGPVAIYSCDVTGVIQQFNHRAAELWGREPAIGDTDEQFCGSYKMFRPDGSFMPHELCPMAEVLSGKIPEARDAEVLIERPDGSRVTVVVNIRPLKNQRGKVTGAINCFYDITERKQSEEARARLAAIVESSDDAIVGKDINSIITSWNSGAERLFGYTAQEAIGQPVTMLIPPDRSSEEDFIMERIHRGVSIEHYETVRYRKDGTPLDVSLTVSPIRGGGGQIVGASKIARDISERKKSDKQRALLMAELDHRVKNTLATVQSIARQTSVHATSIDDFRDAFEARLMALSQTHNLLALGEWKSASLRNIVATEMSPYNSDKSQRSVIAGEDVQLSSNQALIVGLALHELATNAAKYGALSLPAGRVDISWDATAADDGPVLQFRWIETGGPAVQEPGKRGFGSRLIERGLKHELGATQIQLDFDPDGVRFFLQFRLDPQIA